MSTQNIRRECLPRSERRATGIVTLLAALAWTCTSALLLPGLVAASETNAPKALPLGTRIEPIAAVTQPAPTTITDSTPCEDGAAPEAAETVQSESDDLTARVELLAGQLAEHAAAIAWYEERLAELEQRLERLAPPPGARGDIATAEVTSPSRSSSRGMLKRPMAKALKPLGSVTDSADTQALPRVSSGPVPGVTRPDAAPSAVKREKDRGVIQTATGDEAKLEIVGVRQVERTAAPR